MKKTVLNTVKKYHVVKTALMMIVIQLINANIAFAKNAPDLKDINKDLQNLASAPSWFKTGFYVIAGLLAFFSVSFGVLKLIQAKTEMEVAEAKKHLLQIIGFTVAIPIILAVALALISWRFGINLKF